MDPLIQNGNGLAGEVHEEQQPPSPSTSAPTDAPTEASYDSLFPSLPGAGPAGAPPRAAPPSGGSIGEWNRKPKLSSSIVTQVLNVPREERKDQLSEGFGMDDSCKMLNLVMEKTKAKIEMSTAKDKSLTFLITGKQDVVLKARRELLTQFQTQAQHVISIPKEHHRFVLGKGGAKLHELEAKTATKITIPKVADASDKVTISGTKEGIEKAIHEIRIVSDEQSKQAYEVLNIPKMYHPFIQQMVKKSLEGKTNVRVNIPPLSVMKDEMSVAGEKDAVMEIRDQIVKLHKDMEKKHGEVTVDVKKTQHKYVIGPKGNSINEILAETGVFVEMPGSDNPSETITLRGPQDKLGLALTKVYEKANSNVTYEVKCPTWLHKYIIGKKGATIQKITNEFTKVHVEFTDSGDRIKVEGPTEEADKVRDLLEQKAHELVSQTAFVEINVDAKYHKHIIGKGGSTVNKLKQETDVMINIPDSEHGMTTIRIEGNKDGVQKAKKELESMVKKMENEKEKDMIIESRFHRQLIGPKGENIQKLREEFAAVQISFPDLGSKSDIVKLRGPKDDVDRCAKNLTKTLRELQESSYQVKVPIFKQFHKYIIGKGGATIKKIKQETDTRIDLPDSGSDSDMIAITGTKANVEKAREKIQQIQTEMADVVSVEIDIPRNIHNTMIGSGGKLIQSVMDDCGGVAIKFPQQEAKSDKVTIRGPKDDVEKAKKMLLGLSNEKTLSSMSAEVRAKPEHHKFLIGRNGANVQSIRNKTGARIIFPGEKDKDREIITILGTKEAVAEAKKELESRIKGLDNVVEETMTVDPKHHRHFVSRRGEVLRQIGDEFGGVIVSFPRSGVASDKVTLKGAKNCVDGAKARIEEIVHDLDCQVTIEIDIDPVHHRTIMGSRGSKVQRVCADHDVNIKIPEKGAENANIIRISGKKEKCEAAKKDLLDLVPVNIEVEIPYEFHRYIIGAKGENVRMLMNTHDVNIKVPSSDQQSDVIVVAGPKANVEDARQALMDKLVDLEKEKGDREARSFEIKLEINSEYHPKIIGRKGKVITDIRTDFDVNVQLPKKGAPDENVITIIGLEEQANKAKEAIMKIVQDIDSMSKEEVIIDRRVHSMIIGRKGQGIRKIMRDFDVDIKLPRDGEENMDLVVIMGREDNVLDCIDRLKLMEEEFLQDIIDKEWMEEYTKPKSRNEHENHKNNNSKGFKVSGAPWQGASDDAFPTLGGNGANNVTSSTPVWGPRR